MLADAALGFKDCLDLVYEAGAIPVIAMRHDEGDEAACKLQGYHKNGYPLSAHGHSMSFNGLDYQRLRAGGICRQVCTNLPEPRPEDAGCAFRDPDYPLGQTRHVGRASVHPDGISHGVWLDSTLTTLP